MALWFLSWRLHWLGLALAVPFLLSWYKVFGITVMTPLVSLAVTSTLSCLPCCSFKLACIPFLSKLNIFHILLHFPLEFSL